jgi:energy-coupling factor transport system ATP-binding protein
MEIKFKDVSYQKKLKDINLDIESGKIVSIVGASGSGKTTLVELINALLTPSKGVVTVGDFTIKNKGKINNIISLRSDIGFVFENSEEQFFCNTVYDEIVFAMNNFNYKKDNLKDRVKNALKMVNLNESYLTKDPFKLSAGEMRKVAIASILSYNPKIIILDEPFISLDSKSKKNIIRIIKTLKQRYNKTIIIVTNETDIIHRFVDYVYIINKGSIVKEGKKYEVFKEDLSEYGVKIPKVMEFSNLVKKKKNIKLGYRDEINDLIKDIYRYAK